MQACLEHQRRELYAKMQKELEVQRRRMQLAQAGEANAMMAARKVLSQLYRLGGVDIEAAFHNFDHDNSGILDMLV